MVTCLPDLCSSFSNSYVLIKMASKNTTTVLLELYKQCKSRGEKASLFMETVNGQNIPTTFTAKSAGAPANLTKRMSPIFTSK